MFADEVLVGFIRRLGVAWADQDQLIRDFSRHAGGPFRIRIGYINLNKLVAGKRLKFDFALPSRLDSVQLEVRKIKGPDSPVYDAKFGREWIYFRIVPAQKFTSFFADPINLAYDPNGKYLMRFHGRSNIDNDNGGPQDVRIEYEYTN